MTPQLTPSQQRVYETRVLERKLTLSQLAEELGCSKIRVRQIEGRVRKILRIPKQNAVKSEACRI
jgi:DNA-directed RNA polymerase sigma subunit (sigma70/sigma32)